MLAHITYSFQTLTLSPIVSIPIMSSQASLKFICVDTSTFTESIALVEGEVLIAEKQVYRHRGHASGLHNDLHALLTESAWDLKDIDAIVCGIGPGSFTGMRVGIAACKGLAYALQKPLYAIPTPLALLSAVPIDNVYAVIDARRGELYVQGKDHQVPRCWTFEALIDHWQANHIKPTVLIGEGALKYAQRFQEVFPNVSIPMETSFHIPRASLLVAHIDQAADIDSLEPIYVRASDAEINYPNGFPSEARLFK